MDLDYDRKFEEMKKYIPFLENMIKRLESTSSGSSNPRQAQLDKIRSLRDLLQDKKKRMKMENLLKCEQVLLNLYAKVEQRETFSDENIVTRKAKETSNLEVVRNKLKSVTMANMPDVETLPEIARSNEIAEMCTLGSKEPALFQRRPKSVVQVPKVSSPVKSRESSMMSPSQSNSRRGYTRVLMSPETSSRRWTFDEQTSSGKLFSRRSPKRSSPRRSPRRFSPSYHKKDRKKSSKNIDHTIEKNDLNITLNVPEDSLNSLNTKDILSRIITCSNDDVDITTLRELRTQILGELKQTGANDDISDLILKSYKTKKSRVKYKEVEEGELSDSESEAIENIYGSLVVVDKDKSNIVIKNVSEKDQSRKIQICLIINSKDNTKTEHSVKEPQQTLDISDFDLSNENDSIIKSTQVDQSGKRESDKDNVKFETKQTEEKEAVTQIKELQNQKQEDNKNSPSHNKNEKNVQSNIKSNILEKSEVVKNIINIETEDNTSHHKTNNVKNDKEVKVILPDIINENHETNESTIEPIPFKANFYKPLINDDIQIEAGDDSKTITTEKFDEIQNYSSKCSKNNDSHKPVTQTTTDDFGNACREHKEKDLELPFLNEPCITKQTIEKDVVSQIDILQALKNEILNESMDIPGSDVNTPPLHQPKLVKVADSQKITPNRISIEKYKEKTASLSPLFVSNNRLYNTREDSIKKQSIKLTEKECERFNFTSNIELHDVNISSDDDGDKNSTTLDNLYDDLAPKSPDLDDSSDILEAPPVIIPAEPVKTIVVSSKSDVDMRTFVPILSNDVNSSGNVVSQATKPDSLISETTFHKQEGYSDKSKPQLLDPRIRRDFILPVSIEQSTPFSSNVDRISRSTTYCNMNTGLLTNMSPKIIPSVTLNSTPIIPPLMTMITSIMTPNSRTYENTPTHHSFDVEGNISNSKHVYAPSFSLFEYHRTRENSVSKESNSQWEDTGESNQRLCEDSKMNRLETTLQKSSFNEIYNDDTVKKGPFIDRYKIDRREDNPRMDCPRTPVPSFGWSDCSNSPNVFNSLDSPMTPGNRFGRLECPTTPSHPFGRSECPLTPSHPFGRVDCSTAPHLLGRIDCPATPSHPFGRLDCPPTPSHPLDNLSVHQRLSIHLVEEIVR